MLTNNIVSFEQLGPELKLTKALCKGSNLNVTVCYSMDKVNVQTFKMLYSRVLMLCMLGKTSSRQQFEIFYYFPEQKQD